jgi:hypothetical protein
MVEVGIVDLVAAGGAEELGAVDVDDEKSSAWSTSTAIWWSGPAEAEACEVNYGEWTVEPWRERQGSPARTTAGGGGEGGLDRRRRGVDRRR